MPSKRKQYNLVLNDSTDDVLWQVSAELKLSALDAIRELLATHPKMLAKAQAQGIEITGKVDRGGYRRDDGKSSSSQPVTSSQVETSTGLDVVRSNGNRPAAPKRPIPAFVGRRTQDE